MKYSKDTFANKNEINEKFYTKEQIDTMLGSGSGGGGTGGDLSNYYTKSEVDNLLSNISVNSITNEEIEGICVL